MKRSTILLITSVFVYFSAHSIIALIFNPDNSDALIKKINLVNEFHHLKINVNYKAFFDITVNEKPDTNEINYTGDMVDISKFYYVKNDTLSINIDSLGKNKIHSFDINASNIESVNLFSACRNYYNLSLANGNKKIYIKGEPTITIRNSNADTITIKSSDSLRIYFNHSTFSHINIISDPKKIKSLEFSSCNFQGIKVNE